MAPVVEGVGRRAMAPRASTYPSLSALRSTESAAVAVTVRGRPTGRLRCWRSGGL